MFKTYIIYKPYGMLSQFSSEGEALTLRNLAYEFPKDVYPVGRLDADSEGLLVLTNDNRLKTRLLEPKFGHQKTYWVQVEGEITSQACALLSAGVSISVNGKKHQTAPAWIRPLEAPDLPERNPPIRVRKTIPDSWVEVTITEGKNRQVRKMTAAAGFPTLRLVRGGIGTLSLHEMKLAPGEVRVLTPNEVASLTSLRY